MARGRGVNGKGRSKRSPPFVMLPLAVLDSPGFRSLKPGARAALIEVARLYRGSNNGTLAMSQRVLAERLSVNRETAGRWLTEMETAGLIECTRPGGFNIKSRAAQAPLWRLAWAKCDASGNPPSQAYRHPLENFSRVQKSSPNGSKNPARALNGATPRAGKSSPMH